MQPWTATNITHLLTSSWAISGTPLCHDITREETLSKSCVHTNLVMLWHGSDFEYQSPSAVSWWQKQEDPRKHYDLPKVPISLRYFPSAVITPTLKTKCYDVFMQGCSQLMPCQAARKPGGK